MMGINAYHQPHLVLLGKNETARDRNIALKVEDIETTINNAEILKF